MRQMLADVDPVEDEADQMQTLQRLRLPRFELRLRFHHETTTDGALAGPAARDPRRQGLEASGILARRHPHQHLLDHPAYRGPHRAVRSSSNIVVSTCKPDVMASSHSSARVSTSRSTNGRRRGRESAWCEGTTMRDFVFMAAPFSVRLSPRFSPPLVYHEQ
jgi:hypothetical protein